MEVKKTIIRSNPYSVYRGTAAEDIKKDSVVLMIICPELLPGSTDDTLAPGITKGNSSLQDRDGKPISSSYVSANHLVATWEGSSNSRYPPLIRKGETVEVFKTGDQDKFEWRATGQGRDFRTTDRVHIEVGASDPSKPGVVKNDTNTYSAYLDSDAQKMGMKSSKANGEAAAISMEADLKAGTIHLSDDSPDPGNRLFMDTGTKSGTPVFQVNLTSGIALKMEGNNFFLKVPGQMQMDITDRLVINSPLTVFNLAQTGTVIVNGLNIALNAGKDLVVTAGNVVGISALSTKVGGVFVAASVRAASMVKGVFGSGYKPVSVAKPQETPVTPASNSADTDVAGPPYSTGA